MAEKELDFTSPDFNPIRALYEKDLQPPVPNVHIFNNINEYAISLKMGKPAPKKGILDLKESDLAQRLKNIANNKNRNRNRDPSRLAHLMKVKSKTGDIEEKVAMLEKTKKRSKIKNVLEKMEDSYKEGPLSILYNCIEQKKQLRVWTRRLRGLRGVCVGYLIAFDKHMNLAMMDVEEMFVIEEEVEYDPTAEEREEKKKEKKKNWRRKKRKQLKLDKLKQEEENTGELRSKDLSGQRNEETISHKDQTFEFNLSTAALGNVCDGSSEIEKNHDGISQPSSMEADQKSFGGSDSCTNESSLVDTDRLMDTQTNFLSKPSSGENTNNTTNGISRSSPSHTGSVLEKDQPVAEFDDLYDENTHKECDSSDGEGVSRDNEGPDRSYDTSSDEEGKLQIWEGPHCESNEESGDTLPEESDTQEWTSTSKAASLVSDETGSKDSVLDEDLNMEDILEESEIGEETDASKTASSTKEELHYSWGDIENDKNTRTEYSDIQKQTTISKATSPLKEQLERFQICEDNSEDENNLNMEDMLSEDSEIQKQPAASETSPLKEELQVCEAMEAILVEKRDTQGRKTTSKETLKGEELDISDNYSENDEHFLPQEGGIQKQTGTCPSPLKDKELHEKVDIEGIALGENVKETSSEAGPLKDEGFQIWEDLKSENDEDLGMEDIVKQKNDTRRQSNTSKAVGPVKDYGLRNWEDHSDEDIHLLQERDIQNLTNISKAASPLKKESPISQDDHDGSDTYLNIDEKPQVDVRGEQRNTSKAGCVLEEELLIWESNVCESDKDVSEILLEESVKAERTETYGAESPLQDNCFCENKVMLGDIETNIEEEVNNEIKHRVTEDEVAESIGIHKERQVEYLPTVRNIEVNEDCYSNVTSFAVQDIEEITIGHIETEEKEEGELPSTEDEVVDNAVEKERGVNDRKEVESLQTIKDVVLIMKGGLQSTDSFGKVDSRDREGKVVCLPTVGNIEEGGELSSAEDGVIRDSTEKRNGRASIEKEREVVSLPTVVNLQDKEEGELSSTEEENDKEKVVNEENKVECSQTLEKIQDKEQGELLFTENATSSVEKGKREIVNERLKKAIGGDLDKVEKEEGELSSTDDETCENVDCVNDVKQKTLSKTLDVNKGKTIKDEGPRDPSKSLKNREKKSVNVSGREKTTSRERRKVVDESDTRKRIVKRSVSQSLEADRRVERRERDMSERKVRCSNIIRKESSRKGEETKNIKDKEYKSATSREVNRGRHGDVVQRLSASSDTALKISKRTKLEQRARSSSLSSFKDTSDLEKQISVPGKKSGRGDTEQPLRKKETKVKRNDGQKKERKDETKVEQREKRKYELKEETKKKRKDELVIEKKEDRKDEQTDDKKEGVNEKRNDEVEINKKDKRKGEPKEQTKETRREEGIVDKKEGKQDELKVGKKEERHIELKEKKNDENKNRGNEETERKRKDETHEEGNKESEEKHEQATVMKPQTLKSSEKSRIAERLKGDSTSSNRNDKKYKRKDPVLERKSKNIPSKRESDDREKTNLKSNIAKSTSAIKKKSIVSSSKQNVVCKEKDSLGKMSPVLDEKTQQKIMKRANVEEKRRTTRNEDALHKSSALSNKDNDNKEIKRIKSQGKKSEDRKRGSRKDSQNQTRRERPRMEIKESDKANRKNSVENTKDIGKSEVGSKMDSSKDNRKDGSARGSIRSGKDEGRKSVGKVMSDNDTKTMLALDKDENGKNRVDESKKEFKEKEKNIVSNKSFPKKGKSGGKDEKGNDIKTTRRLTKDGKTYVDKKITEKKGKSVNVKVSKRVDGKEVWETKTTRQTDIRKELSLNEGGKKRLGEMKEKERIDVERNKREEKIGANNSSRKTDNRTKLAEQDDDNKGVNEKRIGGKENMDKKKSTKPLNEKQKSKSRGKTVLKTAEGKTSQNTKLPRKRLRDSDETTRPSKIRKIISEKPVLKTKEAKLPGNVVTVRVLKVDRGRALVLKRRHVNQLFVRGDNIIMVAYQNDEFVQK